MLVCMLLTSSATSASIRPGVCSDFGREVSASYGVLNTVVRPALLVLQLEEQSSEISGHPETKWGGSVMAADQEHPDRTGRRLQDRRELGKG
jgi:hypothetical protein